MYPDTAIIGGSGLSKCPEFELIRREIITTPYGDPSGIIAIGYLGGQGILFLPRHGVDHTISPHRINYRANIWALKNLGVKNILAVNAVGGIDSALEYTDIVLPDQILDYTWGREHSFFDDSTEQVKHIEFTYPYSQILRERVLSASKKVDTVVHSNGVYAATQGPRLETSAEIKRLQRDGASIVGMTGMPEAALARELDLNYISIAMVVNKAAGIGTQSITLPLIQANLQITTTKIIELIVKSL